jgi:hypothetical protein
MRNKLSIKSFLTTFGFLIIENNYAIGRFDPHVEVIDEHTMAR